MQQVVAGDLYRSFTLREHVWNRAWGLKIWPKVLPESQRMALSAVVIQMTTTQSHHARHCYVYGTTSSKHLRKSYPELHLALVSQVAWFF